MVRVDDASESVLGARNTGLKKIEKLLVLRSLVGDGGVEKEDRG